MTQPSNSSPREDAVAPFAHGKKLRGKELFQTGWFVFASYGVVLVFFAILIRITILGAPVVFTSEFPFFNTSFFTERPQILVAFEDENLVHQRMSIEEFRQWEAENPGKPVFGKETHNYSAGGIFSPLLGTVLIVFICIICAMAIGVAAAIYLSEYSRHGKFINVIRLAIINLAGVPSIVFGLFGFAFFCYAFPVLTTGPPLERAAFVIPLIGDWKIAFQGWGPSMISAGCTLACMILPVIITACEESLRAVPHGFREASLALGATRWQMIRRSVLPFALSGMLTASILGITRVAGETAPIMYTGAFAQGDLPWVGLQSEGILGKAGEFLQRGVEAMPYHIYTISAKIPQEAPVKPMQNGAVFIFMVIVIFLSSLSVLLRMRIRSKLKW